MDEVAFTILSIDESRAEKKAAIRATLSEMAEVSVLCVDGRNARIRRAWLTKTPGIVRPWAPKRGEIGVWLSQINAWRKCVKINKPLLILEDDAILDPRFMEHFKIMLAEVPEDYDFLSVFVPNNQERDWYLEVGYDDEGKPNPYGIGAPEGAPCFYTGSPVISKVYQGYSCVATLVSPKGAQNLLDLMQRFGLYTPVDCFLFLNAHRGLLKGYAPVPTFKRIVSVDWKASTLIHDTGLI